MGDRYLVDLADVLRRAGLKVTEQAGWQTRARRSGGFEGNRPWCVMWHHTAGARGSSTEATARYASYGSSVAPVCNVVLGRDGEVIVCAAGATNTNGAGGRLDAPVHLSRGTVPTDQMNTHAVSIEACNDGVGEDWPQAQIDAFFKINNALTKAYGLASTDCCSHATWSPGRKIDPARASAVRGPWKPRSVTLAETWALPDIRSEARRRAGSTPPLPGDDDVQVRLLILTDSDAQFLAMTDDEGQALYVTWAGPGGEGSAADRAVTAHRAAAKAKGHDFEQEGDLAGLFNCVRVGPLPYGDSKHTWDGSETWSSAP